MFTGCGTALVTPFRRDHSLDEDDAAPAGAPADRCRHRLSGALRHHRRKPHADARRASARGRNHARRGHGQGSRARRRGRLQHPRGDRAGPRAAATWASTAFSPSRPTTTSPPRKASTSTTRPSPPPSRCPSSSTACRAAPASTSSRPRWRASPRSTISSASRKPPATSPRWPTCCTKCRRDFTVLSGDDAITIPLMALGGRGIISVVSNEIPGEMTQLAHACLRRRFRRRARQSRRATCR